MSKLEKKHPQTVNLRQTNMLNLSIDTFHSEITSVRLPNLVKIS